MLKTILVALDAKASSSPAQTEIADLVIETLQNLVMSPDSKVILCHVFPHPTRKWNYRLIVPIQNQQRPLIYK